MAVHHRKLMTDRIEDCGSICNPVINTEGYCPISCMRICLPICRRQLPPPPPPPEPSDHRHQPPFKTQTLHFHLVISLSILAAICLILSCSAYYKYYRNWAYSRRRSSDPQQQQQQQETRDQFLDEDLEPTVDHPIWYIRTVGLQPSAINSITICKYKRGDGLVEGTDCSVCLSEFQEDETLRLLPKCNHAFHLPCIDTWLRSHTNCPLCRAGIVTHLPASTPVQIVSSPASREGEAQVVISEGETGDGDGELRTGPEVGNGNGENSCETSKEFIVVSDNGGVLDEIQPMRRSVSMDAMSASMLSIAIANTKLRGSAGNSDSEWAKPTDSSTGVVPKRVESNQSLLRIVGSSSSSMKRSLSCSGKVLLSRNSRGRNLPS